MAVVEAYITGKKITIRFPKGYMYLLEKEDYDNFRKILIEKGFKKVGEYVYTSKCSNPKDVIHNLEKYIGIIVKEFII